jgi:hypothetical protein
MRFEALLNLAPPPVRQALGYNHELIPSEFYDRLTPENRGDVRDFVAFAQRLRARVVDPTTREIPAIGVIAVGSTLRSPQGLAHAPEDIDLRLLHSFAKNSPERELAVRSMRDEVRSYLYGVTKSFQEMDQTVRVYQFPAGDKKGYLPWADFYNQDPAFVTTVSGRLPLHISISGVDNPPLDEYLHHERQYNGHFALLYKDI